MIYNVTSYDLNKIIEEEIRVPIESFWNSNRDHWFNFNYYFGGQEVKAFIYSSPYFTEDLKEFLDDTESSIFIEINENWYNKFLERVYLWAESDLWLYPEMVFNGDLTSDKDEIEILDLTPQDKALLYRKKYF